MLNMSDITKAVVALIEGSPSATEYLVKRGDYINDDPHETPWVGVYRSKLGLTPLTIGRGSKKWNGDVSILVIAQQASMKSGDEAEDRLEAMQKIILEIIDADPTLGGTVQTVVGYDIEYTYKENERESIYFHEALITISARAKTGG